MKRTFIMSGEMNFCDTETEVDMAVEASVTLGEPMTRKDYGTDTEIEVDAIYIDGLDKDGEGNFNYLWKRVTSPYMKERGMKWLMSDEDVERITDELYEMVFRGHHGLPA